MLYWDIATENGRTGMIDLAGSILASIELCIHAGISIAVRNCARWWGDGKSDPEGLSRSLTLRRRT